jgi:hypothetical protein
VLSGGGTQCSPALYGVAIGDKISQWLPQASIYFHDLVLEKCRISYAVRLLLAKVCRGQC